MRSSLSRFSKILGPSRLPIMSSLSSCSFMVLLITISLVSLLTGCVSQVVVNVNAITDQSAQPTGQRYYMINANDDSNASELYFREFRSYLDHLLAKQGYTKVDHIDDADLELQFHYGVSDGRTGIQHYSWPIYETFGGERVRITERITDSSGTRTINRTVYLPAYVRQVGSAHEAHSYTIFNRYFNLSAFPVTPETKQNNNDRPIWNVNVHSVGESNDLRAIMPYLVTASYSYLGKNSGQQKSLTINEQNALLLELKALVNQ